MRKTLHDFISSQRTRLWLAIAGSATILLATSYTMVQQSTRLSADDLPLTTAQTAKEQLDKGVSPDSVIPKTITDLKNDATLFVTITDKSQKILASNASLDGEATLPPQGTFDYTKAHSTDHFTWGPVAGVRQATRMSAYNGGYVITGHSLTPFEDRINTYGLLATLGWLAMMIWTYVLIILPAKRKNET